MIDLGILLAMVAMTPLFYIAAHRWINAPTRGEPPMQDSFAAADLRAWGLGMRHLASRRSLQILPSPGRPGEYAGKFALAHDDPDVKGSRRAELRFRAAIFGHPYGYAMQIFVPPEWQSDCVPVTVVQWHNVPDLWRGDRPMPSVLRIDVVGDRWSVELNWGVGRNWFRRQQSIHSAVLWHAPLDRGRWTNWKFYITWACDNNGSIEAWKDGVRIIRHIAPNAFLNSLAPYLKFGLYVPAWKNFSAQPVAVRRREIWFSHVSAGRNRARVPPAVS
jgi:hypothetical protein